METTSRRKVNDSNPLTTFVQADTKTFKDVVQRLTGSSEEAARETTPPSSIKQGGAVWQQHFQEQQRFSPSSSRNRVLQTSPMASPTKYFSSLSLVEREDRGEVGTTDLHRQEEEKAIRERRFYLHPSPRSKPGFSEPELLSLFPLTSPGKMESQEFIKESNNR